MSPRRSKAIFFLLAATLIWGAAGPITKFTFQGINPVSFLGYRFTLAATVALLLLAFKIIKLPKDKSALPLILLHGLLSVPITIALLFLGLERSTVLDMGLIALIGPLLMVAAGEYFFRERVTKREKVGIAVAFTGTAIAVFAPIIIDNGESEIRFTGNIFIFSAMLTDTASAVLTKKLLRKKVKPLALSSFAFIIGAVAFLVYIAFNQNLNSLATQALFLPLKYQAGVFYMAIFSGTLGYTFYMRGQRTIGVGESGLFAYLQPLVSVPLAVLWLGEKITPIFIVGAVIIATGVFLAEHKSLRHSKRSRKH